MFTVSMTEYLPVLQLLDSPLLKQHSLPAPWHLSPKNHTNGKRLLNTEKIKTRIKQARSRSEQGNLGAVHKLCNAVRGGGR